MPITDIYSYLVHPSKKTGKASKIGGANLPLNGKMYELLDEIYQRSEAECDIEIAFTHKDGKQQNDCRDLLLDFLKAPDLPKGRTIAERLEVMTTRRSGLGLLFIIAGKEGNEHKLVISRFPTDSAILAEEDQNKLNIEYLERVFMKSATAYKAAVYKDSSFKAGFWKGQAIDRQINDRVAQVSDYWVSDFLASGFLTTPAAGTRKFAIALRNAIRTTADVKMKSEISAAVTLAKSLNKRKGSALSFLQTLNLSDEAIRLVTKQMPDSMNIQFQFDLQEFSEHLAYRSVELDNGGMMTAEVGKFDSIFHPEKVKGDGATHFSTQGRIVGERLGKSKIERLGK